LESREVTVDLAAFEPSVPGPVAAVIVKLLRNKVPLDEICERTGAALEHVVRIERLRRQFEAERAAPPAHDSQSRIVVDDDDPVARAWGEQVDQRARGADEGAGREPPGEAEDTEPKSKRRA
jgi:hypothetical protein